MNDFVEIIVSTENTQYMAWQTLLFCSSCIDVCSKHPTVVVHRTSEQLRCEFKELVKQGCRVVLAPSFSQHPIGEYQPRNELGTLLFIADKLRPATEYVLFCEPDMIFVRKPRCHGDLCGEFYEYLDYSEPRIMRAAKKFGLVDKVAALNLEYCIGVPYCIPRDIVSVISKRWLEVLDSFDELQWIDIMYAFGIALASLSIPIQTTQMMDHNQNQSSICSRDIIHYCYGDRVWNKRHYMDTSPLAADPGLFAKYPRNSILGEIGSQVLNARERFQQPRPRIGVLKKILQQ